MVATKYDHDIGDTIIVLPNKVFAEVIDRCRSTVSGNLYLIKKNPESNYVEWVVEGVTESF